jgi:DNA-binding CsgD family transcriptional regulator
VVWPDRSVEHLAQQALTAAEAALGQNDPSLVQLLNAAGLLYTHARRFDQAEQLYRRALLLAEARSRSSGEVANAYDERDPLTEPHASRTVEIRASAPGELASPVTTDQAALAAILGARASAHELERQLEQAARVLEHGLEAATEAEQPNRRSLASDATVGPTPCTCDDPELVTTLSNLATLLEQRDQREEAVGLRRRALNILERSLEQGQVDLRTSHVKGAPLSRREREVAALVARGLTNREIAAKLEITERTAGAHVEHILGKLGFSSRTQVAVWAAEHGPVGPAQIE